MKKILTTAIALITFLNLFSQAKLANQDALKNLEEESNIILIDVRTEAEFQTSHLKNAININWNDKENFENIISTIPKKNPIYIYCKSGGRSEKAVLKLAELGYNAHEIEGGILQWEADNLPVVSRQKEINKGMSISEYTNFIKNNNIVLVYFTAAWCGPCKELSPIVDKIENKYKNKIKVLKIDVDQNKELATTIGIRNIPALHIYKDNKIIFSKIGIIEQSYLESYL